MAKSDMSFLEILNDDCIYHILDRLSLDDLCNCSRTCKRLQELCGSHFRRKYPNKVNDEVTIKLMEDGKLRVLPCQNYVKCFNNFVKNVTIFGDTFSENRSIDKESKNALIVNFVKSKCDQNLHRIFIYEDVEFEWIALCKEIENFLCNVEIVQFTERSVPGDDEAIFLNYCHKIRRLILYNVSQERNVNAILQQQYLQLTHFFYIKASSLTINAKKLKTFFKMNSKVQCVAWEFDYYHENEDMVVDHVVQCIQAHDYALNLEHLFLSIGRPLCNKFNVICRQLKVLCDRDRFKNLELKFTYYGDIDLNSHANQLAGLKQLTKIHLHGIKLTNVIPALQSLSHLKIIVLSYLLEEYNSNTWSTFEELKALVDSTQDMALPQIEEVQIEYIGYQSELTFYIMQFARHWINLERMLVPSKGYLDTTFRIDELNQVREKLRNARELTIFTNHKGNATNLNHGLVKLQFIEFERCIDSKPFQVFCMKV